MDDNPGTDIDPKNNNQNVGTQLTKSSNQLQIQNNMKTIAPPAGDKVQDQSRIDSIIALLKQCKQQGKTYYQTEEIVLGQGFTKSEVDDASDQFEYVDQPKAQSDITNPVTSTSGLNDQEIAAEELKEAKTKVRTDSFMQLIPFIGIYYKYKMVNDSMNYESLKTRRRKSTVYSIWIVVMIIAMIIALFLPDLLANVSYLPHSAGYLLVYRYIGIAIALGLLTLIYNRRS